MGTLGLNPDDYLELTQREINIKIKGYLDNRDSRIAQDWQLAYLITVGYHDPKKFPKLETLLPKSEITKESRRKMVEEAGAVGMRVPD